MLARAPILVVEDDVLSRKTLSEALSAASIRHVCVSDGAQALQSLAQGAPSLVLLDLVMPKPDGFDVLRIIRARADTRDVPVLVLTALDSEEEAVRVLSAGADDFVRKPYRSAELIARIQNHLRLRAKIDEVSRRERDTRLVLDLTQAVGASLEVHEILLTVVRSIVNTSNVAAACVVLPQDDPDGGHIAATNTCATLTELSINLHSHSAIAKALSADTAVVVDDAETVPLPATLADLFSIPPGSSIAVLPIACEDRGRGVLLLRASHPFDIGDYELSLAKTAASATAIALRNAHVVKSLRDKTERVTHARFKAERRLRLLERYEVFFESVADGIIVTDIDGQILFSNARAKEVLGTDAKSLREGTIDSFVHPDQRGRLASIREGLAGDIYPQNEDLQIVRADGSEIIASVSFSSVLSAESAVLLSLRDVTRERAIDAELRKTKEFLESVIDSSANAIISVDRQGIVRLFNHAAERCFGINAEDIVGIKSVRELFPSAEDDDLLRALNPSGSGGLRRVEDLRTHVMTSTTELVPVSLSAALISDGVRSEGSVIVLTDLRDKLRMEARLAAAQEELQSRERQAIIAELAGAAAHELNQPLTSVMGYAELLKRKLDRDTPAYSAVEVIMNEAERMAEIVRKIGKITRYETKNYVGAAKILDLDRASEDPRSRR